MTTQIRTSIAVYVVMFGGMLLLAQCSKSVSFSGQNGPLRAQSDVRAENIQKPEPTILPTGNPAPIIGDLKPTEMWHWKKPEPTILPTCNPAPIIGDLNPTEMWHWSDPAYSTTYSSPVAGDIDADGTVEIVSIGSTSSYDNAPGQLSVIDGKTGQREWIAPGVAALASTTPAIVDLDGDGFAEIITTEYATASTKNLVVIDYKTRLVRHRISAGACGPFCMAAVADINGDGLAEIVAGNVIVDSKGNVIGNLAVNAFFVPTIAELVPASKGPEIVVNGGTVLSSTGQLLFRTNCEGTSYPYSAVSDLNHDGTPELVCAANGNISVWSNSGSLQWQVSVPKERDSAQNSGAPNVGDFNGDGLFEIGSAGGDYYVVYDHLGKLLWKSKTTDWSSSATGSTIFDFNGDGKVEVVYNDEKLLRIYDGSTGTELWSTDNPSGTLWEYPLIVNLDDSSSAEIIVSSPTNGGIRAFRDPNNRWVTSRPLWNQYSYYPQIVDDNIRAVANLGLPIDGFRVNTQGSARSECRPN
jgi:hypothetical protein